MTKPVGRKPVVTGRPAEGSWPAAPPGVVPTEQLPPQPDENRVKVLHVITRLYGGSGGNTLLSAVGMHQDRYEVWLAGAPGGPLWQEAEQGGVTTVHIAHMREQISPVHDLLALRELVRLMRRERFSVVHTHCAKAGLLARLAARLTGTPVVVHTFHAFAAHPFMGRAKRRLYLLLDRLARPMAHHYVAVAPRVAREAVEARLTPPGRVSVVPSAVELDGIPHEKDPDVRGELGIPDGVPVVGTVGRLVAQKAPLDFVRMAASVRTVRPDTVFVMVGDTTLESRPLEAETRAEAARLGVDIVFTGFRPDAPRIASAFDVFVISSLYEGLGRALTEAMASGRPVVATAVNGVPDLVEPGATGLLAEPSDPEGLATNVLWLLDHPEEAARMGAQGRDRVLATFAPAHMCGRLDALYAGLLGLPPLVPRVEADDVPAPRRGELGQPAPETAAGQPRNGSLLHST